MPIFVDSSRIQEIEEFHRMGIIRGVTTNPTILRKDGIVSDREGLRKHIAAIADLVRPLPVSAEVLTNEPESMRKEALEYAKLRENINVKVPIHGPEGEIGNLALIHELESRHDVRVNVTAMMSAQQCLLAAAAGATYVSIFGGRVNNMGYDSRREVERTRALLDRHGLKAKIIVGSTREVLNIVEWLEAGADIVTATPELIRGMIVHPYTKETVRMFLRDGAAFR